MRSHAPIAAILTLTIAGGASACQARETAMNGQDQVLAIDQVFGLWRLSREGATGDCVLALQPTAAGDHHGVMVERCGLAEAVKAAGWRPTVGGFELLDGGGRVMIRFDRTGVDAFEGRGAGAAVYRLGRAAEA
jgi:hypothetical protein